MIPQFSTKVMSSFLLWMDNLILTKGSGFTNFSSKFYPVSNIYNNLYTYGLPFKQVAFDQGISSMNQWSGVYINGNFASRGVSGLVDLDYENGRAYFSSDMSVYMLSGNYAVKDFNIKMTNLPEEKLLFETKFELKPKTNRQLTGLASNEETIPVIFLKSQSFSNEPFAFGGMDQTEIYIRAIVLADSLFNLDSVCSLLVDRTRTYIPILDSAEFPFNSYGGLKSGSYNYVNLTAAKNNSTSWVFLDDVKTSTYNVNSPVLSKFLQTNPNIHPALINFKLTIPRYPRLS